MAEVVSQSDKDILSSEISTLIESGWSFSRENVDSAVLVDPETLDRQVLVRGEDGTWQLGETGTTPQEIF